MSRQERVNCASLATILVTLLLFAGYVLGQHAATRPATAAPVAVEQAAGIDVVTAGEGSQEPSGVGGLTISALHADASATLASLPQREPHGQFTIVPEYAASYESSMPTFPATYLVIESTNYPGIFHVFNMVASQRA